jgi:hypothetical protein
MSLKVIFNRLIIVTLVALMMVATNACAALQPSTVSGPKSNLPPYPILGNEPEQLEGANIAWQQLVQRYSLSPESSATFHPITGTIQNLPSNPGGSIFLPKVGDVTTQTEEQTRESLRRFIVEWRNLIGADPNQLSLVERIDESSGVKVARYEQKPFRIPLRGGFGKLVIRFQSDRRVIGMSSTCLQKTDRLQAALAALTPKVTSENAPGFVRDRSITARDATGQERTFTLSQNAPIEVQQLVVYVVPSLDQQTLEVRLAWEIDVTNGPIKTIYLDAVTEQVFAIT